VGEDPLTPGASFRCGGASLGESAQQTVLKKDSLHGDTQRGRKKKKGGGVSGLLLGGRTRGPGLTGVLAKRGSAGKGKRKMPRRKEKVERGRSHLKDGKQIRARGPPNLWKKRSTTTAIRVSWRNGLPKAGEDRGERAVLRPRLGRVGRI